MAEVKMTKYYLYKR